VGGFLEVGTGRGGFDVPCGFSLLSNLHSPLEQLYLDVLLRPGRAGFRALVPGQRPYAAQDCFWLHLLRHTAVLHQPADMHSMGQQCGELR
jgi:hypothetical protein